MFGWLTGVTIKYSSFPKFAVVTNIVIVVEGPHTEHMGCLSANLVLPPVSISYLAIAQYTIAT